MKTDEKKIVASMQELAPVITDVISKGGVFPLTVKGISMHPFLHDSVDTAVFSSLDGRKIRRGDIILFRRKNGQYAMHRVCRVNQNGTFDFLGDNQMTVEPQISAEQLVAFVPQVIRNGKKVNCEKGFLRSFFTALMMFKMRFPKIYIRCIGFAVKLKSLLKRSDNAV